MRVRFPHTVHVLFVTTGCSYQVWQSKGATPLPPTFENFVCLYFEQNVAECSKFYTAQLSTQHNFSEISQIITPPDPPPPNKIVCLFPPACPVKTMGVYLMANVLHKVILHVLIEDQPFLYNEVLGETSFNKFSSSSWEKTWSPRRKTDTYRCSVFGSANGTLV